MDDDAIIDRITDNCSTLANGYNERVEYVQLVKYHEKGCPRRWPNSGCKCREEKERRSSEVSRPGLLAQLQEYTKNKDVNANPKAARGAPRVKTPKLHPELNGFLTLDEITSEAYVFFDRILEEGERDRAIATDSIKRVFEQMPYQLKQMMESRPDLVREADKKIRGWIHKARVTLFQTVSDAMFADTVCGNCGGGLTVPWDNNGEVKCIGTPVKPPCGETYPMSEWVRLYEESKRAQ